MYTHAKASRKQTKGIKETKMFSPNHAHELTYQALLALQDPTHHQHQRLQTHPSVQKDIQHFLAHLNFDLVWISRYLPCLTKVQKCPKPISSYILAQEDGGVKNVCQQKS